MITILQEPLRGLTANQVAIVNENFSNTVQRQFSNLSYTSVDTNYYSQNITFYSAGSNPNLAGWKESYSIQGANNIASFTGHSISVTKSSEASYVPTVYAYKGNISGPLSSSNAYGIYLTGESNNYISSNNLYLGTSSVSGNGYTYLPNGILLQWGSFTTSASGNFTLTFQEKFKSACFVVNGNGTNCRVDIVSINSTAAVMDKGGSGSTKIYWQAIGR
jgi:parallel beta-helix repeat protein